ncbi:MAG: LamG-like jellyroll fold domain-containing protein [Bacteroidota bacterium]
MTNFSTRTLFPVFRSGFFLIVFMLLIGSLSAYAQPAPPPGPPTIDSFSPISATVGDTVYITGTNFSESLDITVNNIPAGFVFASITYIKVIVPVGAHSGAISIQSPLGTYVSTSILCVPPVVTLIAGGPINLCPGGSVTLTSSYPDSLQWYYNDSPLPGANSASINAMQAGQYYVVVELANTCLAYSDTLYVTADPTDIKSNMKLYSRLNSTPEDYSGNANVGTIYSSVTPSTDRFENAGGAYNFNRNGNLIFYPSVSGIDVRGTVTVCAWVKASAFASETWLNVIIGADQWGGVGTSGYTLRAGGNGNLSFNIAALGDWKEIITPDNTIETDTWVFVTGVYDGHQIKAYKNAVLAGATPYEGSIVPNTNGTAIGNTPMFLTNPGVNRNFMGDIDDVRIFNRALSDCEIAELYNRPAMPEIASFNPSCGAAGDAFAVSGINLQDVITLEVNGINADIADLNEILISSTVPAAASTSGKITIASREYTDTSLSSFTAGQAPAPTVTLSGTADFCEGDSVIITSSALTGNLWNNGMTTRSITAKTAGSFTVSVIAQGCTSFSSEVVTVTTKARPATPVISFDGALLNGPAGASAYHWYYNGNLLTGETESFLIPQGAGQHRLSITGANGCVSELSAPWIRTGIAGSVLPTLKLVPNPAANEVRLSGLTNNADVHIYNSVGKLVFSAYSVPADQYLNLASLSPGVYSVKAAGVNMMLVKQ